MVSIVLALIMLCANVSISPPWCPFGTLVQFGA